MHFKSFQFDFPCASSAYKHANFWFPAKAEQKNGKKTSGADAAAAVAADIIHNSDKGSSNDDDDDDWEPEPVEPNGMLSAGMGKLVLDKDLEKSEEQRLDMLHTFFLKAKEEGKNSEH